MNDFLTRFRILPLLVIVAMVAFAIRIGDTMTGVRNMASEVMAEEAMKLNTIKPAAGDDKAAATAAATDKATSDAKAKDTQPVDANANPGEPQPSKDAPQPKVNLPDSTLPEVWADPGQASMADSPEQQQLQEDLAARRRELDAREKALENREALMKATEKQIDDKLTELTQLKDQIQKLLGEQNDEQTAKIGSLVKIYEGMKAKDAATIFDQMDMDILVQVVSRMNERKSAPVIAAMDTTKANQLTVRLTEMKQLPEPKAGALGDTGAGPVPTPAPEGSASLPGLDALGKPGT